MSYQWEPDSGNFRECRTDGRRRRISGKKLSNCYESSTIWRKHPFVRRIIVEVPDPTRSRHHVEVIRRVAMWNDNRVISARNHHDIVIFDRHRFVEAAIVGVNALKREALRRLQPVIVDLLERALDRKGVGVMLVWRVARGIPGRGDYFDGEQRPAPPGLRQGC